MPSTDMTLDKLSATIVAAFPEHRGASFTLLAEGWDSVAVDVDNRLIFKFPREAEAETALRREAGLLRVIGPRVSMPVPRLTLFEQPRLFSRHDKIAGAHLVTAQYANLSEADKQALGAAMGQFYAELHAIDHGVMRDAGALPLELWLEPDEILRRVWTLLDDAQRRVAKTTINNWAALPPEPHGTIYGFFDGHGWNMAFDHAAGRLNGIYDFADSGFGPLHQEFIYSSLIAPDLTERIIAHYEATTGKDIDRRRVRLITGAHRLWELAAAVDNADAREDLLAMFNRWDDNG